MLVCAVARILSDRWIWSQYLFWIPEEAYACTAVSIGSFAWLLLLFAPPHRPTRRRLAAATAGVGLLLAHLTVIHWRLFNAMAGPRAGALRILNWNITAVERDEQINDPLNSQKPDVAILVNPHSRVQWPTVINAFTGPSGVAWDGNFIVLSHARIVRHAAISLNIQGAVTKGWRGEAHLDPGRAMYVELDTTLQLGRPIIIWIVDLPSDWRLSRWDIAAQAAAAINNWSGSEIVHETTGALTPHPAGRGFPAPDIVLGDFNSPRGSASQRLLAGSMAHAYDQAGSGYAATWPGEHLHAPFPILHLDQMFLAPWLRAVHYEIVEPLFGYHWPQVADIKPEK